MDFLAWSMRGSYTATASKLVAYFSSWGMLGAAPLPALSKWRSYGPGCNIYGPMRSITLCPEPEIYWQG